MWTDVHWHPTLPPLVDVSDAVVLRALEAGVTRLVATGYDLESSRQVVELARQTSGVYPAVGYHPWYLDDSLELPPLESLATLPEVVALGEIGLDGKVDIPMELQLRWFHDQLTLAKRLSLPVVVHSRKALPETLEVLQSHPGQTVVLHSFGGSGQSARPFVELGCYFSFSGTVTRPNAKKPLSLLRSLPVDRILLETDAPSIGLDGVKAEAVEPCHLPAIAGVVAEKLAMHLDTLRQQVARNTEECFGLTLVAGRKE